ncbi:MAG: DUF1684 domain-containing protein, partial [Cytophagales bacterium]
MDGIANRILAVDVAQRNYAALFPAADGYIFYSEIIPNQQGQTYHPYSYCAYSKNYSCPIVPEANDLPIKIEAGVKLR